MSKDYGNAFEELMKIRGREPEEHEVSFINRSTLYKTPFQLGETAAEALAARAVAVNDIYELRTGQRQQIEIDVQAASATCLGGTDMTLRKNENGEYEPIPKAPEFAKMESITQPWETKDGKWFLPHFNLPHLEKRVCGVLGCEPDPQSVARAVKTREAGELDQAIADARATGGILYTEKEWLKHPQGQYLAGIPVVEIVKIADGDPEPLPELKEGDGPLSGLRVLDLTRILAGPTCGISMAEHGADVLMVTSPELPQVPAFVRDTSHGKRSCYLDYKQPDQAAKLKELAKDADVFIEGYRPGRMEANGFGAAEVAKLRPGIVYVSVNCFGSGGPLSDRAGWDQVAQAVTGMCFTQGEATNHGRPQLTPVFACDFLTGYLGAYGALLALARRAKEGGSYHVHVSLCQSAMLIQRQGLRDDFSQAADRLPREKFEQFAVCDDGTYLGDLKSLGPVIRMSETSPRWERTTPKLGSSKPEWLR